MECLFLKHSISADIKKLIDTNVVVGEVSYDPVFKKQNWSMKIYLISRFLLFFFKGERQSETEVRTEGMKVVLRDTFPT